MVDNLTIGISQKSDGLYEAKVTETDPLINKLSLSSTNVSCLNLNQETAYTDLVTVLRSLGYSGPIEVIFPTVSIPAVKDEPYSDWMFIDSETVYGESYKVTYDESKDSIYLCECEDFRYRAAKESRPCKHIRKAVFAYSLGTSRPLAVQYARHHSIRFDQ